MPTPDTYAVQQEAPLFVNAQAAQTSTDPQAQATPAATAPSAKPIGVVEPSNGSFDIVDVGIKLIAVLALAYGSLMLLKRVGLGGGLAARGGANLQGMRVVRRWPWRRTAPCTSSRCRAARPCWSARRPTRSI